MTTRRCGSCSTGMPPGSTCDCSAAAPIPTWSPMRSRTPSWPSGVPRRPYRGEGDVGAWIWGIAIRRLISRLRARRGDVALGDELIAHISPAVQSAEDQLLVGVEYGDVGAALRSLSPSSAPSSRRPSSTGSPRRRRHASSVCPKAPSRPGSGPPRPSCAGDSSPRMEDCDDRPHHGHAVARRTRPAERVRRRPARPGRPGCRRDPRRALRGLPRRNRHPGGPGQPRPGLGPGAGRGPHP